MTGAQRTIGLDVGTANVEGVLALGALEDDGGARVGHLEELWVGTVYSHAYSVTDNRWANLTMEIRYGCAAQGIRYGRRRNLLAHGRTHRCPLTAASSGL